MLKTTILLSLCLFASGLIRGQKAKTQGEIEETKILTLVKKMTLEEKVGLLHANSKFYVSGVERLGIPELALSDGPHGVRAEINRHNWSYSGWTNDSSTCFPPGTALAASWNPALAFERGLVLGEEARFRKKDVLLGPGINIIRSPLCGRNFEYLSEDPFLISAMAVPYIQALQSKDVAASVKHYLANNQEDNRFKIDVSVSERALRELYLPGFKAAITRGGALTVMAAYNKFRGDWCSENDYLDRQILRNELGFNGVLMTDWDAAHSTVKAALAGLDLEMGTDKKDYNEWYFANPLIQAVKEGKVPLSVVNEKVSNILRVMMKIKMLGDKTREIGSMNTPDHQRAAYNSAAEAIVLLQNQNKVLPVDFAKLKSIAVIGDNATRKHTNGGLSSEIKTLYEVTPLEALTRKFGSSLKINFAQGYEKQSTFYEGNNKGQSDTKKVDWKLIDAAVDAARKSDIAVIFGGLNHDFDTESFDRQDMKLPYGQEILIQEVAKANPNTIVAIIAGSPLELSGIVNRVPSILWAWYGGMEAGNAVADVLSGKVNPSGKMPFTLPVSLEQNKMFAEEIIEKLPMLKIDTCVYHDKRLFRLPLCKKFGKQNRMFCTEEMTQRIFNVACINSDSFVEKEEKEVLLLKIRKRPRETIQNFETTDVSENTLRNICLSVHTTYMPKTIKKSEKFGLIAEIENHYCARLQREHKTTTRRSIAIKGEYVTYFCFSNDCVKNPMQRHISEFT